MGCVGVRGDSGCDSLDIAALWPASASVGGMEVPELNSAPRDKRDREEEKERL
jgi:hypothetical protein